VGLGEEAWLGEGQSNVEDRARPVLVQLAEAKAYVVDDAFMLLAPLGHVAGRRHDGLETNILAELGIDDPLLHHRLGLLETLVHGIIHLGETLLEEILLLGEFLLDGGLLQGNLLDLVGSWWRRVKCSACADANIGGESTAWVVGAVVVELAAADPDRDGSQSLTGQGITSSPRPPANHQESPKVIQPRPFVNRKKKS